VLGGRDLEALHPARQRRLVVGLDPQVDVRALDADVDDPEVLASRRRERRFADRLVGEPAAQAAHRGDGPQHDVHRVPGVELGPLAVRRPRPPTLRLAASPPPLAAALLEQRQLPGLPVLCTPATP
jgi:hypothetical protein